MGEALTARELSLVFYLFAELPKFKLTLPMPLFGDNQAALKFAEDRSVNDRVKHIDLRHHWLHGLVTRGIISMNYVCTTDNIADLLTKPLNALTHNKFSAFLIGHIQPALRLLVKNLTQLNSLRHKHL